jgi:hypothetical protein
MGRHWRLAARKGNEERDPGTGPVPPGSPIPSPCRLPLEARERVREREEGSDAFYVYDRFPLPAAPCALLRASTEIRREDMAIEFLYITRDRSTARCGEHTMPPALPRASDGFSRSRLGVAGRQRPVQAPGQTGLLASLGQCFDVPGEPFDEFIARISGVTGLVPLDEAIRPCRPGITDRAPGAAAGSTHEFGHPPRK